MRIRRQIGGGRDVSRVMSDFPECKRALWRAIDEARVVGRDDRAAAEFLLLRPAIRLAEVVTKRRCMILSSIADAEHIQSVVTQAVWEAIARVDLAMDTRQVFQFLLQRATHAVADAAREADPLPRRARTYRTQVLLAADKRGIHGEDARLRQLAREMFPRVHPQTFELMVRGAPPSIDVDRAELAGALPIPDLDPADEVVARHRADAIHVAMSDQPDPAFRAWAARVLAGDDPGKRVPRVMARRARQVRRALAAWA